LAFVETVKRVAASSELLLAPAVAPFAEFAWYDTNDGAQLQKLILRRAPY
jgi:hypothetical protein